METTVTLSSLQQVAADMDWHTLGREVSHYSREWVRAERGNAPPSVRNYFSEAFAILAAEESKRIREGRK